MFTLARAVTYSTLFIGLLLIFLPAQILSSSGFVRPTTVGPLQAVGIILGAAGACSALLVFRPANTFNYRSVNSR